jgi:DNA/RNA-binding domain of Phe-tRNA-synthetase-like protein
MKGFSISDAYRRQYPNVGFGLVLIEATTEKEDAQGFNPYKRKKLRHMRRRQNLEDITARIHTYRDFFETFDQPCPLVNHLQRTINSGFPRYSLLVDAHFMAEMCAGILVAVTDDDRFDGALLLDVADDGETCRGMGGRLFTTRRGEIILRDEKEIVCVLCQGADEKTRVHSDSRNVLFYAFGVPGIDRQHLRDGLAVAADTVTEFGGGNATVFDVF